MALPGVLSAWLSVHALLCACHDQDRSAVSTGFPVLDDLQGPDQFPSAATEPARALPAGFPVVDDLPASVWFPSAATEPARALPAGFPVVDDLQEPVRSPSAAWAPARTLPAGFPVVDDLRESVRSPTAARAPARTRPEEVLGSPAQDDLQGPDQFPSAAAAPARTWSGEMRGFPTLDDLQGLDEVPTAKIPDFADFFMNNPTPHSPLDYHPDLTEIVLIAGHADGGGGLRAPIRNYLSEDRGWEQGLWMTHMEDPKNCYFDKALTWRKDTECYATWSATDDVKDFIMQSAPSMAVDDQGNPNTTRMCGFDIDAFVAFQMQGFMRSPDWPAFVNYFRDTKCETVRSVGHSLGGAMATLFAACANARTAGFGERHDFGLITFGTFPISPEPLYSGTPGTPFNGTRYHIANPGYKATLRDPKAFRLDLLELHRRVADISQVPMASFLDEHTAAIADLDDDAVEPYWADKKIQQLLRPLHRVVEKLAKVNEIGPGMGFNVKAFRAVQRFYHKLALKMSARGDFFFDYDPISQLNKAYGYKHPLLDFQPVSNKNNAVVQMERVPAEQATDLPDVDPWQSQLGIQTTGRLPNHYICCYYRGPMCVYLFKASAIMMKACVAAVFR